MIFRDRPPVTTGENEDKGAALPLIASMIVVLIGLSAFAIDLGWLYLNSSQVQRAADSAALAGVVYLPGDTTNVTNYTVNGANANGYDIGTVNGTPIAGGGPDSLTWQALADNRLQVTLESQIPTFFLKVLGFNSFDISRTATAEYVKPVPLGSPDPCFGIGDDAIEGQDCNPSPDQNYWAAISGPYTNKRNGDQYATRWYDNNGGWWSPPYSSSPPDYGPNGDYRSDGYYFAVEVPSGVGDLDIDIYDASFDERGSFTNETGDHEQDSGNGADTNFQVYYYDNTPLDPTDNSPVPGCSWSISSNSTSYYTNNWRELCSLSNPDPGIWVLQVWTSGNDGGTNQYGIRATTDVAAPARVYGINDISIFNNLSGTSTLNVAEVDPAHAGKVLEIDLFDPGEDDQNAYMTVKMPDGSTPSCTWIAFDEDGAQTQSGTGSCQIQTSDGNSFFNGELVRIQIDIPTTYSCSSNCWWTMEIINSQPHDRTTWAARVVGNPVRLTPNA
ncbi:MAG: pilus assembly protein TadG-related protein [Acidimicrobiia bacterium]|jgi:hypothetical protein